MEDGRRKQTEGRRKKDTRRKTYGMIKNPIAIIPNTNHELPVYGSPKRENTLSRKT
jgi:hypothetical protein